MLISKGRLAKFPKTPKLACMVPIRVVLTVPFPLPYVNQGDGGYIFEAVCRTHIHKPACLLTKFKRIPPKYLFEILLSI